MGEGISLVDKPGGTEERFSNEHAVLAERLGRHPDDQSHGDTSAVARRLQPQAHYVTFSGGDLQHPHLYVYLPIVATRIPSARTGDPYVFVLGFIDLTRLVVVLWKNPQ